MSNVDFGRYRRIVQAFWDPEPKNDDASGSSIWCLGRQYASKPLPNGSDFADSTTTANGEGVPATNRGDSQQIAKSIKLAVTNGVAEDRTSNQTQETEGGGGWPSDFSDDCEARIWFTYRSSFPAIRKSSDASMTLSVRLRSLGDQQGFTSDTGWGCMIRSGQSLLANALLMLRLGRGMNPHAVQSHS